MPWETIEEIELTVPCTLMDSKFKGTVILFGQPKNADNAQNRLSRITCGRKEVAIK